MAIASISEKIRDPRSKKRNLVMFLGLILLVAVLFISMIIGTANTSFSDLYNVFVGVQNTESYRILYHIRIPRVLTAMFAGINLAIAGCILQGVLKNPLADPGIIGVSAGAGLAAMVVMIVLPEYTNMVPIVAFVGAMVATLILFALAWEEGIQPLKLILAGVAVSAFFAGGMTCLMVFFSDKIQGSLVYKGRKVALYGGAYAPSYLPNDVDTFTCGVNCGNHQIRHPPLIVKVHFFPCVQIAGNFFDLFQADGIHTQLRYLFDKLLLASVQFFNLAVHIGEQDGICPGQRVNERFNFVLDLCEFYLQGGQLWIGLHRIFSPLDGLERF